MIKSLERWGCIRAGLVLFQNHFLSGLVLVFEWGELLFKSGLAFKRIRYIILVDINAKTVGPVPNSLSGGQNPTEGRILN